MTFASLPDRRADLDPNGPAVSDGTRSLTNAGLLERVRAARRHLDERGVGAGDVVALKLRNRVEFVVLLFTCWRLGATVTPVNPSLTDAEDMRQLEASGARLLVVDDGVSGSGRGRDAGSRESLCEGSGVGWVAAGGSVDAGAADLHQRYHRGAQGGDA